MLWRCWRKTKRKGRAKIKRSEAAKIAKEHSANAVSRIEFKTGARFDDPYKRLAAAVILQAAIDKLRGEDKSRYWYYGRLVSLQSEITPEDYQFYADIAGINYSWEELLQSVRKKNPKLGGKVVKDAAELFCE